LPNTSTEISPDRTAVASELERIAASPSFRKADRCVRLLRYVTDRALEGRGGELKEYALGVSVFDRPDSFDPRTDPVVRLEARRLRLKLAEYYQQEGLDDPVVIELPKGAYVPHFRLRYEPVGPVIRDRPPIFLWIAVTAAMLGVGLGAWYVLHRRSEGPVVRASIAVLGFRDLSSSAETSWIDPAVSELMNIELGEGQQLRTLPPENVARMRTELSVTPWRAPMSCAAAGSGWMSYCSTCAPDSGLPLSAMKRIGTSFWKWRRTARSAFAPIWESGWLRCPVDLRIRRWSRRPWNPMREEWNDCGNRMP